MREEDLRGALDSDNGSSADASDEAFDQSKVDYQLARAIDLIRGFSVFQKLSMN